MEIVQAVKKLNSISREWMSFRTRPILCTTLYRNPMQASNFGGTFDQLFLWICLCNFHTRCPSIFLYLGAKSKKMTKNSNQGVGSCLNPKEACYNCTHQGYRWSSMLKKYLCNGKSCCPDKHIVTREKGLFTAYTMAKKKPRCKIMSNIWTTCQNVKEVKFSAFYDKVQTFLVCG